MEVVKFKEDEITKITSKIDFEKMQGIIPTVAIGEDGRVLMLAFMTKEALEKTLRTGMMHYWSRSRNKLWMKGEESKHYQYVLGAYMDCDSDAMLFKVNQIGPACHTNQQTCFFNPLKDYQIGAEILYELEEVIKERMQNPKKGSHTSEIISKGSSEAAKKVGEEAVETAIASLVEGKERTVSEAADLLYHLIIMLQMKGIGINDIFAELRERRK
jgi:phosphoribosyl-ATP pyrophosphohydrolase/phosphoribosyl-AMP cyclohydrolase